MKKGIKIAIGVVLLGSILVFLFLYSTGDTALNKERKIHVLFPNVEGLIEASPLLLNGFRVGEVKEISLKPDTSGYKPLVTFVITANVKIPKNSTARIVSSDLFNKGVELMLSEEKALMAETDTLEGFTEESFGDKISKEMDPLKVKAKRLASSFDSISFIFKEIQAAKPGESLKASFRGINKSMATFKLMKANTLADSDKTAIKAIMLKVNSIMTNITNNKALLQKMSNNFSNISNQDTKDRIAQIMKEVNDAMAEAKSIVTHINQGKGTAGQFMNTTGIQDNLTKANNDLSLLLKEMIRNPDRFFKVSVFAPKKVELNPDSI